MLQLEVLVWAGVRGLLCSPLGWRGIFDDEALAIHGRLQINFGAFER